MSLHPFKNNYVVSINDFLSTYSLATNISLALHLPLIFYTTSFNAGATQAQHGDKFLFYLFCSLLPPLYGPCYYPTDVHWCRSILRSYPGICVKRDGEI